MADLIIRGMGNIPVGQEFVIVENIDFERYLYNRETGAAFHLVPLPEGHGRLGDLDALMPDFVKARWEFFSDGDTFLRLLKNAPTIIEADLEWKMKNCCCFSNTDQAEGDTE